MNFIGYSRVVSELVTCDKCNGTGKSCEKCGTKCDECNGVGKIKVVYRGYPNCQPVWIEPTQHPYPYPFWTTVSGTKNAGKP